MQSVFSSSEPFLPYAAGGSGDQPLPAGFTGIVAPEDGSELVIDASERSTNTTFSFQTSNNAVYRRNGSGMYASVDGTTRTFEDAYFRFVSLDALVGYSLDGSISLIVTRKSNGEVVHNETISCVGPDDNSYASAPRYSGTLDVYKVQVRHVGNGTSAFDGLVFSR